MLKRRNWNTSSKRGKLNEDSPLNLDKDAFGEEYRWVLDKLLEPKLPDNRELQADPSYEYAQKAMKIRVAKKVDLLKNTGFWKFLQRKTHISHIRNMLWIMKHRATRKFSLLEVDHKLGIK